MLNIVASNLDLVVRKSRSTTIHYVNLDSFGYSYLNNLYDTTYHIGHSRYLQFSMLLLYYIDHKDVWVL
jgi:hypothetical protein